MSRVGPRPTLDNKVVLKLIRGNGKAPKVPEFSKATKLPKAGSIMDGQGPSAKMLADIIVQVTCTMKNARIGAAADKYVQNP